MNRRNLLKLLGLSAASLAVPDNGGWRFLTQETSTYAPAERLVSPLHEVTDVRGLTRLVALKIGQLHLETKRDPFLVAAERDSMIGDEVCGFTLTEQAGIDCLLPDNWEGVERSYAEPMAWQMLSALHKGNARVFGRLPLPSTGVSDACYATDPKSGVTVRGLSCVRPAYGEHGETVWEQVGRFDVLYGRADGLN